MDYDAKKYNELLSQGMDVLYDDTDKSIGEKFAIADLLGIYKQIRIGKKVLRKKLDKKLQNKIINNLLKFRKL